MPEISVIMPVYNTKEEYLREAIESILNQSFEKFEFIIINDCSTNNAKEVILSYKDDRIRYFENEQNQGVSKSANFAFNQAQGKYIARIDSDDVAMLERLEIQYNFLEKNPEYQLCSTRITKSKGDKYTRGLNFEYLKVKAFLRGNPIIQPTVMYNREFFYKNNLYYSESTNYGEDWDLWTRFCLLGKFAVLEDKLLYYRQHPEQANKLNQEKHYSSCKKQFSENLKNIGFNLLPESQDIVLDFLCETDAKNLNFEEWKLLVAEVLKILYVIKKSKKLSFKYSFLILVKKLLSYTKYAIIS